jgi:hypothetical protein
MTINKINEQDQQAKAAFTERNPHTTQQKEQRQGAQEDQKNRTRHKEDHGQDNQ